ncbi:MAG: hypothetical protein DDT36_01724 [Firmicutes bacterium]|nr:hypothetical protein [Bacillota bacterium]
MPEVWLSSRATCSPLVARAFLNRSSSKCRRPFSKKLRVPMPISARERFTPATWSDMARRISPTNRCRRGLLFNSPLLARASHNLTSSSLISCRWDGVSGRYSAWRSARSSRFSRSSTSLYWVTNSPTLATAWSALARTVMVVGALVVACIAKPTPSSTKLLEPRRTVRPLISATKSPPATELAVKPNPAINWPAVSDKVTRSAAPRRLPRRVKLSDTLL